jgi:hypothetical protein
MSVRQGRYKAGDNKVNGARVPCEADSHSSGQETNSLCVTHHETSQSIPILRRFNSIPIFIFLLLQDNLSHLRLGFPKQSPPLRSANP